MSLSAAERRRAERSLHAALQELGLDTLLAPHTFPVHERSGGFTHVATWQPTRALRPTSSLAAPELTREGWTAVRTCWSRDAREPGLSPMREATLLELAPVRTCPTCLEGLAIHPETFATEPQRADEHAAALSLGFVARGLRALEAVSAPPARGLQDRRRILRELAAQLTHLAPATSGAALLTAAHEALTERCAIQLAALRARLGSSEHRATLLASIRAEVLGDGALDPALHELLDDTPTLLGVPAGTRARQRLARELIEHCGTPAAGGALVVTAPRYAADFLLGVLPPGRLTHTIPAPADELTELTIALWDPASEGPSAHLAGALALAGAALQG